jgi:hypothetical protein
MLVQKLSRQILPDGNANDGETGYGSFVTAAKKAKNGSESESKGCRGAK